MQKTCKNCFVIISQQNGHLHRGSFTNECRTCRALRAVLYRKLKKANKLLFACEFCNTLCIRRMKRAFCSDKCKFMMYFKKDAQSECWMWQGKKAKDGYGTLCVNGKRDVRAHRFSYELFKDPIKKGNLILHSCHSPSCVNPDHLREGSVKENAIDMVKARRHLFGSKSPVAKIMEQEVGEIRKLYNTGKVSQKFIANIYGVSQVAISQIIKRITWAHVP